MQKGFKANFLSDPSTYPIILITGFAVAWMTGMGLHALTYYKDVRIAPSKKHTELRTWGYERKPWVVQAVAKRNREFRPIYTEGLGVNHQVWLKAHETTK